MVKLEKMFTPLKISGCELKNRFVVTAMVSDMCDDDGYATEQYIRYHEAKAKGGYGLIITEDYAVNAHAGGYRRVARIYKDDMIAGHKKMVDTVHKYGTKIFCQIYHAGRQANSHVNGGVQPVAASVTSCPWNRELARELSVEEIHGIVKDFGLTAANAKKAGFDGIEIHAGNGYLIAGFMSLLQNKRTDEYGGCFTNRMRLLKEVYDECRAVVGKDFPIMIRFSAEEHERDGRTLAESRMIAKLLQEWGFDAINCSNGLYGTYNLAQVSTAFMPHAWTSGNAAELKKIVDIPVLAVNSIDDPIMAESLVENGFCDFVGMSRCSLADPEMPNKAKEGRFDEIRPCIRCVQGCTAGTIMNIPIRCCVNPEMGNEYKYTFEPTESKNVLIVGGGPGGMWAAVAAARRGHKVTIWEKNSKLGGEFLAAMYPPTKGELATYIAALDKTVRKLGVDVVLGKEATAEEIRAFGADKVILATGGVPIIPRFPGVERENIVTARDVLLGNKTVEGRIVVIGGGEVGIETALYLAQLERGKITVVEMMSHIAPTADPCRVVQMKDMMKEREIELLTDTKVLEITDQPVVVAAARGCEVSLGYDAIVLAIGYRPYNSLQEELRDLGEKVVTIGDAVKCTNAMEAATQGFDAGYNA